MRTNVFLLCKIFNFVVILKLNSFPIWQHFDGRICPDPGNWDFYSSVVTKSWTRANSSEALDYDRRYYIIYRCFMDYTNKTAIWKWCKFVYLQLLDHHQLPPVIKNMAFQKYGNMEQSLFARFVRLGVPAVELDAQGRARPRYANFINWSRE